nr:sterol desaturase family protein [Oharaeibacter diazotrophicus]
MGVALGHVLVRPLDVAVFAAVFPVAAAAAPWQLPIERPATWIAGFLVTEFSYYWMHRASHRVRWLWASHSVHHSSTTFTLASALRLAWTGVLSGEWLFFVPAVLLGFPPTMVAALLAANLVYQFVLHTELSPRWGPLERVLNTPSHHRVHHAADGVYLDRNYGGVLIVFDRLFGTFAAERPDVPPTYGIAGVAPDRDPVSIAFGEWRRMAADLGRAGSWRAAAAILFGPPGG